MGKTLLVMENLVKNLSKILLEMENIISPNIRFINFQSKIKFNHQKCLIVHFIIFVVRKNCGIMLVIGVSYIHA